MILPGRLTIWAVAVLSVVMLLGTLSILFVLSGLLLDILVLLIFVIDAQLLKHARVEITAIFPDRGEVDCELELVYRLDNHSSRPVRILLEQPLSPKLTIEPFNNCFVLGPRRSLDCGIKIKPLVRGNLLVLPPVLTIELGASWAQKRQSLQASPPIRIYPPLQGIRHYENLRRHHALGLMGVHRRRLLGAGRDFEQLRDYLPDDDFRDINWRASAHHQRIISNVYQSERSQDILICIDAGRMMGAPVGPRTILDHAVDATIMLAHIANRQQDKTGLVIFSDRVKHFIKPAAGSAAVSRIFDALVQAAPESVFPSYAALAAAIRVRQNRRCMIFLFTDLNDPQLAVNLMEVATVLCRRHVLTVISLRDPLLDRVAAGPAYGVHGLYQVIAARHLALERDSHKRSLTLAGAGLLESDADRLTIRSINEYLTIKARQLV